MYRSCLVCHGDLGDNAVIAAFPVGRRIVFDPVSAKIWVICPGCSEWNLAPLDERWEALEQCEAAFAASVQRLAGADSAIAEAGGVELIRVGSSDARGLATWRYAERLESRRRRKLTLGRRRRAARAIGGGAILAAPMLVWGLAAVPWIGVALLLAIPAASILGQRRSRAVVARVAGPDGRWIDLRRRDLAEARLVPGADTWSMRLRGRYHLEGADAVKAARHILPLLNWRLSDEAVLSKANEYLLSRGRTAENVFMAASRRRGMKRTARIARLDPHIRLALEMVANEESERRAIESELRQLRDEWRHAHELAQIQDELLTPAWVNERMSELRKQEAGGATE